ncbi:MAG: hypothetical protein ACRD0P_20885 [Stackebrandtia sp.]
MTMPGMRDELLSDTDMTAAPVVERGPVLPPDQCRTAAALTRMEAGYHALSWLAWGLRLHPEAAPVDDREAPGRRCGNCDRRETWMSDRRAAKCALRWTHSTTSQCQAWWPGCTDHRWREVDDER